MLTISTVLPTLRPLDCTGDAHVASIDHCTPTSSQVAFFYSSLYLLAFAQGGHKPCAQAFGADQFDHTDPQDLRSRSSFFNWWNFSTCCGALLANILLSYIQDYISWTLGFAIPCFALLFALCLFLLGSKTYRFYPVQDDNPFARAAKTLHMAVTSIGRRTQSITSSKEEEEGSRGHQANISLPSKLEGNCIDHNEEKSKEANCSLLKLFPIWVSCLVYGVVYSQPGTLFIKQGSTMDRRIGSSIQVPPAALQSLLSVSLIVLIPIYDHILVPVARSYSKLSSGITMLQRIGAGIALSMLAMVTAALVEMKRLHMARELGLVEIDHAMIPMSLWWLAPQYFFMGASMVFVLSGMQEFFYDQVPDALRSLGLALYLSVLGVGAFISSVLVFLIDLVTSSRSGGESWFSNNLNKGHLDYFYWLLAGLSVWGFLVYIYFAQSYCYRRSHK